MKKLAPVRRGPARAAGAQAPRALGSGSSSRASALVALREGREALSALTTELDGILLALRGDKAGARLDRTMPDRLRAATRRAGAALAALSVP